MSIPTPHMFGTVGAGDDALLVQAAIDNCGACHLPAGTYNFQSWLNLSGKTGVVLTGEGIGRSIIRKPDAAPVKGGRVIYLDGSTDVVLEGFSIDGNGAAQTAFDEDAAIEVWNQSRNVTIRDVRIKDALRYGVYVKGDTTNQPSGVTLERVQTSGSLGKNAAGIEGALGRTGVAVISCRDFRMVGCEILDTFDVEPNTTNQWVTGEASGNVFRGRVDLGIATAPARYDGFIFRGNRVYASGSVAMTVFGGLVDGNIITAYDGPTKLANGGIGIFVPGNNSGAFSIQNNRIEGFGTGIGLANLQHDSIVSGNQIDCHEASIGSTTIQGAQLDFGGIVLHPSATVRGGAISGNLVAIKSAFASVGGMAVKCQGTDIRGIVFIGNRCVLSDTRQVAPVYLHVTANFSDHIEGNAALVRTNLSGGAEITAYRRTA